MTRAILIFVVSVFLLSGSADLQQKPLVNPFEKLVYDRVVAYDYDGMANYQIVRDGQLVKFDGHHGKIFHLAVLTNSQVNRFNKIIGDPATYGAKTAACFDPHLGIVYYQKEKIVGYVSICTSCNYLEPSVQIPASRLKKYYEGEGEYRVEITANGFTIPARKKILDFCKELKFSQCNDNFESIEFLFR